MPISRMQPEDIPEVVSLLEELNEHLGEDFVFDGKRCERQFASMDAQRDSYSLYVNRDGPGINGFVSVVFYESFFHKKGTALVNELVVSEKSRGSGIGKALLLHAIDEARGKGYDEIEVGVMKDNEGAIRFYKAAGLNEEYLLLGKEFS